MFNIRNNIKIWLLLTDDSIFSPTFKKSSPFMQRGHSVDTCPGSPIASKETNCQISTLLMIIHSGSVLGIYLLYNMFIFHYIIL